MRKLLLTCAAALVGCGAAPATYVHSTDTTLGRVVVYRNGVAYFERTARVDDDHLNLAVPADKIDDFLKSLTVVDARTGEPAPIAYPTKPPASESGLVDMRIGLSGPAPHQLRLSYVTEAPSWKPSYRVVVGQGGKIDLQAWAIVDNTSGEDWKGVKLGVGSSSAMSFRFDLRSVRNVERETLQADSLFAIAPPMGGSTYRDADGTVNGRVLTELTDETLAMSDDGRKDADMRGVPGPSAAAGLSGVMPKELRSAAPAQPAAVADAGIQSMARALRGANHSVVVEGFANAGDGDKYAASLSRANKLRDQLVRNGVDPNRIVAVGRGESSGRNGGVRVVEAEAQNAQAPAKPDATPGAQPRDVDPIGASHFESGTVTNVARGTSAMVSILHTSTDGEVVYLYDAESARGNAAFPFRAMRLWNPTDSTLESGPVSVFGDGKFIGEGLCEPIPAKTTAFVPFALDRQIVVEHDDAEKDEIARILTVQRGVFHTEVKHTKRSTLTLHNRGAEAATVYVRHTVAPGYKLTKTPGPTERVGTAYLVRVSVAPHANADVTLEEETPLFKTTDVRTPQGLDLVKVYLSTSAEGPLRDAVAELVRLSKEMGNIEQQLSTMHEQMNEYRQRMDELHVQIVTLRAVKTAGPLMQSLERKLQEMSDKLSKGTIDIVTLEEKRMIARVHFEDGVADLTLEKKERSEAKAK